MQEYWKKIIGSFYPGYFILSIFCTFLILLPHPVFSQWSDSSIEKTVQDKVLASDLKCCFHNLARNLDSAIFFGDRALTVAKNTQNKPASCLARALLARTYLLVPDYNKALEFLDEAVSSAIPLEIPELNAYIQYITAVKYYMLGKKKEAIDETTRAISIYEQLKDSSGISSLCKFIGTLYIESGGIANVQKACIYFRKSLGTMMRMKDPSRMGGVYGNMSEAFLRLKQYDSAEYYLRRAIRYNKENGNRIWLATDYMGMGDLKTNAGQYDSAEYYMLLAGDYFTHPNDQALYLISRGQLEMKQKQFRHAGLFYKQAYELALKYNNFGSALNAAGGVVKAAEAVEDKNTAVVFLKECARLKDSISSQEKMPTISLMEIQREHDLRTRQMKMEKEQLTLRSHRKSIYITGLVILSVLLLLISVVVIWFLRLRQRAVQLEKAELNNAIELKNKEMTMTLMSMMKKNELISGISRKLLEFEQEEINEDVRLRLKHIAGEIMGLSEEKIWEEFEVVFKQIHADFYRNLIKKYPDLTAGDLRLCALLRLNLTTKEISQLNGQSTKSIEVGRTRLRKKLGITDQDVNLVAFISAI